MIKVKATKTRFIGGRIRKDGDIFNLSCEDSKLPEDLIVIKEPKPKKKRAAKES